jgi:hypothetical protein
MTDELIDKPEPFNARSAPPTSQAITVLGLGPGRMVMRMTAPRLKHGGAGGQMRRNRSALL